MEMVGRGDDYGVDVFVVEYSPVVFRGFDLVAELLFGALEATVVEVGDGQASHGRHSHEFIDQLLAANAAADEADGDGIFDGRCGSCCALDGEDDGGRGEQGTTRNTHRN